MRFAVRRYSTADNEFTAVAKEARFLRFYHGHGSS